MTKIKREEIIAKSSLNTLIELLRDSEGNESSEEVANLILMLEIIAIAAENLVVRERLLQDKSIKIVKAKLSSKKLQVSVTAVLQNLCISSVAREKIKPE